MSEGTDKEELLVLRQVLSIPQRFSTGPVMGRFLQELRDHKRIIANKCPKCGRRQLPPREVCAVCHVEATEWEELPPQGTIRNFDVVYYASPDPLTGEVRQVPYVLCWVNLDGTTDNDDPLWHLLKTEDLNQVRRGARVRVVFADERHGTTEDIEYFEIIENEPAPSSTPSAPSVPSTPSPSFVVEGKLALPYQYFAGATGSRFLIALRDQRQILGVRCERCRMTWVPPRQTCERCFAPLSSDWAPVGPEGFVTNFTVVHYAEPYQPQEPPYVLAMVRLDGADSAICHFLACNGPQNARVGMRVRAVFAQARRDDILSIAHFEAIRP